MYEIDNLETTNSRLFGGAIFLLLGFLALETISWAWAGLFVGGLIAWFIAFRKDSFKVSTFPRRLWLIPLGVIAYLVLGILIGLISRLLGFEWASNPASGKLGSIIFMIPFMLMGEELLGIGILEGAKSKGFSFLTSSLLSALIFGLMHTFSYWDGSIVSTIAHVLLLQGVARLIFNYVYLKTGRSIWGSWVTHVLVDLIALSFASR